MPYLGLAVGTALLLVAIRNRVHVGLAAAVAALVVAAMSGNGMNILARALHDTVIDSGGLTLLISIALITMIGSVMKASGAMDGLMRGISSLARDSRWVAFLIPSLMGFLSVPGAAVFSAPMVDSVGDALDMSPEQKVTANIMFRHAWYYIYPISTTLLLAQQVSGLPYRAFRLPGSIAAALAIISTARLVFPRQAPRMGSSGIGSTGSAPLGIESPLAQADPTISGAEEAARPDASPPALSLLLSAAPILVILILALLAPVSFPVAAAFGVLTGVFVMQPGKLYWQEVNRRFREGVVHGIDWLVVATVAGTVFFGKTVANSPALDLAGDTISTNLGSLLLFGIVIPTLASFVVGSHTAGVAITVPLLLPLIADLPAPSGFVVALFMASFSGYLLSPAHVCLTATVQYLKADMKRSWQLLIIPSGLGLLFSLAFWAWQALINLA